MKYLFSRNKTSGMTSKGFTNTLKLATVYACGRQTVELMERNLSDEEQHLIDFVVTADDVKAAFEFVKMSLETYRSLKVRLPTFIHVHFNLSLISFPLLKRPSRMRQSMKTS